MTFAVGSLVRARTALRALLVLVIVADASTVLALQGSSSTSTTASRGQEAFSPKRTPVVRQDIDKTGATADAAMARGAVAFRDEKFEDAIREYERAVAITPTSSEAHYWLGLSHYYLDHAEAAVASLRKAVDLNPSRAEAYVDLGLAYTDLGDHAAAMRVFRTGLVIDAKLAGLWAGLGVAQTHSGDLAGARASLEKAMALASDDCDILMAAVYVATNQRDFEFALARALECRDTLKEDPAYWFTMARLYAALRREAESITCLEQSVKLKPNYAGYVLLGDALVQNGRIDDALAAFQQAVRIEPNRPEAVSRVGVAYSYLGEYEQALFAMQRALELDPTSIDAKINLANCYVNNEKPTEALATIRQVLEAQPENPAALAIAGESSAYVGALDAAVSYYERALRADANYHEARVWLAVCLAGLGRSDDAVAELVKVGPTAPAMAAFYERDLDRKKRPALYLAVVAILRSGAGNPAGARSAIDAMRSHNPALADRIERVLKSAGRLRG